MNVLPNALADRARRLEKRLERERATRRAAEEIAERALRQTYGQRRRLELLEHIAVHANEAERFEEALQFVVDQICAHTGWPVGHAWRLTGEGSERVLTSTSAWAVREPERFGPFRDVTDEMRMPVGVGLPGRVASTARAALFLDLRRDVGDPRSRVGERLGLRAAFAFPALAGRNVVAVLEFFADRVLTPGEAFLNEVVVPIGTQLGRVYERERTARALRESALYDPLTGLPNRRMFMERFQRLRPNSGQQLSGILFVDLDRFKAVNDSLGHLAGDELLVGVARRIERSLRPNDMVARFGGDEFTILLDGLRDVSDATRLAERLQKEISAPLPVTGQSIVITASIGIATTARGYDALEELLRDADTAMYGAKAGGRARTQVFEESMHQRAVAGLLLETDLRMAVERAELRVHYQPIVELETGRIHGFEALLRWERPGHGLVGPLEFIPAAEETGLIAPIGRFALREACRRLRVWQERFPFDAPLLVSVNLSPSQLTSCDFPRVALAVLKETGLDPRTLKFELTETAVAAGDKVLVDPLNELRALGIRVQLDDFGTGYSSLSCLERLPIDGLKLDRSFVVRMRDHGPALEVARAIVGLSASLGLELVVEGIETSEQLSLLRDLGCRYGQGFLFSPPLDAPRAEALLAEGGPSGRADYGLSDQRMVRRSNCAT